MSKVDLFVHGQLSKNGYFTCIFGVVHYPMRALIKHGEIGEDSKAAPEKLNHQPFAKNQN